MIARFHESSLNDSVRSHITIEAGSAFAYGDNSYGALGIATNSDSVHTSERIPLKVSEGISAVKGSVQQIAASGFASFALVGTNGFSSATRYFR